MSTGGPDSLAPQFWAVIPAAGVGRRMQTAGTQDSQSVPKQYLPLLGEPVIAHTLKRLDQCGLFAGIVLVLGAEDEFFDALDISLETPLYRAAGGAERMHSVLNGLAFLQDRAESRDWILVHDAVRPCVSLDDIGRLVAKLSGSRVGGLLAAPVKETLKQVDAQGNIEATVPREEYRLAATPQMFRYEVLKQALNQAVANNLLITDEAHAVEAAGLPVKVVAGSSDNIKITHPEDLMLAEFILSRQQG